MAAETKMESSLPDVPSTICQLQFPPYREASFDHAIEIGKRIAYKIGEVVKKSQRETPEDLLREAQALADFRIPTERLIGFIGNSGNGKSSTVNSVLDERDLAKAEACGSAVTPFAVEYRFRQPRHQSPFTLDCTLMVGIELGNYLGNLLEDFRRIDLADQQDRAANLEGLEADSRAARDVFEAAFDHMEGFEIEMLEYYDNHESREAAKGYLKSYAQRLELPDDMQVDGAWIHGAQDAEQCQEQQSLLQERGLWPFVKRLSVYSEIGILGSGLTLVDLPGYQDTNLARVRAARRAQSKCDNICVVVNIARAIDDPIIPQTLESQRVAGGLSNSLSRPVTVICTHSADTSDRRSLEKLADKVELGKARMDVERIESSGEDYKSWEAHKNACDKAQLKLDALLINARNAKVRAQMHRKYGSLVRDKELHVFCIDNALYHNGTEEEQELSGIPQLRQHLQDLPAELLFQEKDFFIANMIPALVGSFMTWTESSSVNSIAERPSSLPGIDGLQPKQAVTEWAKAMVEAFEQQIDAPLEEATRKINSECLMTAKQWEGWAHQSVGAWLNHRGTHRTPNKGFKCWNAELLQHFKVITAGRWQTFEEDADALLTQLETATLGPWKAYLTQCRQLDAPAHFVTSLKKRNKMLRKALHGAVGKYSREIQKIKADASSGHSTTSSYMVDCMLETYQEARTIIGKGSSFKRHQTLQSRVSSDDLVDDYREALSEAFNEMISEISTTITDAFAAALRTVTRDLGFIQTEANSKAGSMLDSSPDHDIDYAAVAAEIQQMMTEMDGLAATAREMARQQYG